MNEYKLSRMIGLRETGLSYLDISARTWHVATAVERKGLNFGKVAVEQETGQELVAPRH